MNLELLPEYTLNELQHLETLVYTSSLFIIPINIAAYNGKYILMNVLLFVTLTSWAHHACRHMNASRNCIYDQIDKLACITLCVFGVMYTLFYNSWRKFIVTLIGILLVILCYSRVIKNRENSFYKRGLDNWKYHKPHIIMHLVAVCTAIYIAI